MDNDDEQILELEFADDNLESMGYERPVAGPLVLYNRHQQQGDEGTSMGALFRPENTDRATHATPHLGRLNLAPRHEADTVRGSDPKALLNTGNLNINISVNSEDTHFRRRAVPPLSVVATGSRPERDGDGGTENGLPRHARPNLAGSLFCIACLLLPAALFAFLPLWPAWRGDQHGPVQLSSVPAEEALHVAPGAFSKAHENLKQDLAQLEQLFYRARSALPRTSSLRHILEDGPQPQALREEVEALGGLHDRLVGNVLESEIARGVRVSTERLRAVTAELDGKQGVWGSGKSLAAVRAELTYAKHMVVSVTTIMADVDAAHTRAARICARQPFQNSRGSWALSEDSTCPKHENQWELGEGSMMSLGNSVSDAQATFSLVNWVCHDLDTLTSTDSTGQVAGSIAAEARRGLEAWELLLRRWSDLEAAIAAN